MGTRYASAKTHRHTHAHAHAKTPPAQSVLAAPEDRSATTRQPPPNTFPGFLLQSITHHHHHQKHKNTRKNQKTPEKNKKHQKKDKNTRKNTKTPEKNKKPTLAKSVRWWLSCGGGACPLHVSRVKTRVCVCHRFL